MSVGRTRMTRVCAWCRKEFGDREPYRDSGDISYGICQGCLIEVTRGEPRTARQVLSLIGEPVFLIDAEGAVKSANEKASDMLGKDFADFEGLPGGDVFECAYAGEDGGCGRTIHCKTCAIRNTVMDTLNTGRGYHRVPAFQNIQTVEGPRIMKFVISTERAEDGILLRIDEVA